MSANSLGGRDGTADADGWRTSRLDDDDLLLAVADLHNHSLFSDGDGDPETAFTQIRDAGLDVAALTDHSSIPRHAIGGLSSEHYPHAEALAVARSAPRSIDDDEWRRTGEIADAHDVPGEFTALRGFEWTEPWLGHVNVWFSDGYVPVTSPGSLSDLFTFLDADEPDALFGYNHPGREPGDLDGYARPDGEISRRMVALEVFNRRDDYLLAPRRDLGRSPIVDCLEAGWQPALIGCSDEHGTDYALVGKGRTGLWVGAVSRAGVREAMLARRAFATREVRLRLAARLDGVRAGGRGRARTGRVDLAVDLAVPAHDGRPVELQLLTGADGEVHVVDRRTVTCGEVHRYRVEIAAGTRWLLLRVADPARGYTGRADRRLSRWMPRFLADHPCANWALAYASPWYLSSPSRR